MNPGGGARATRWRWAAWGAAALLFLAPLAATQLFDQMRWGIADFVVFGTMLAGACAAFELSARTTGDAAFRAGVAVALAAAFLLVWANLALGVVGSEGDPVNLLFGAVPAVAAVGAALARLRPRGMARAAVAAALAQASAAVVGASASAEPVEAGDVAMVTAFFVVLWLTSAWLFGRAARAPTRAGR